MNRGGFSVARKVRCIRTRTRAIRGVEAETGRVYGRPPVHAHAAFRSRRSCADIAGNGRFCAATTENDAADAPGSAAFLARMLQFGDSMFPIGGFSFSCGLESAIQKGVVADVATLDAFARTAVEQAARGDGIALIAAHRAATPATSMRSSESTRRCTPASSPTRCERCRCAWARSSWKWVRRSSARRCSAHGANASKRRSLRDAIPSRWRSISPCRI